MSLLSRRSQFFHDMFSLPQPGVADSGSSFEGCPVVVIHDAAEDLANLLTALYDGPTFGNNDRDDFRMTSGILRLASKYMIDSLRTDAILHLSTAWPTSLKAWDAREELASSYEMDNAPPHNYRYPSPIVSVFAVSSLRV